MNIRSKSGPITESYGRPLRIGIVPEITPPTFALETRPVRYASIQRTMASSRPKDFIFTKKPMVDGVKDIGKIKVDDISCLAFIHHARNRFLEDEQVGETGPMA